MNKSQKTPQGYDHNKIEKKWPSYAPRKLGASKGKQKDYNHIIIEKKWQKKWLSSKIYKTAESGSKDKFYVLDMFPYPSGEGLHVGHPKGYIATDVISRAKRMNGMNVLHPMGFDAFGLPAENYALKTKTNPMVSVAKNVARYKKQLEILGCDYDWSREINTTDPKYYKWTQWIFLQLLKKGLAYESYEPINWCPSCKTGLANEDVEDGRCERCGTPIEKKPMRQWVLKITDYAERLLNDLELKGDYKMPILIDKVNPHEPGLPIVKRRVAHAIVFDPINKKYLIIRNKKFGWNTVVIGGIEENENPIETAVREVREETGYIDLEFKKILGEPTEAHYCAKHKGQNRIAYAQAVYFELKSHKKVPRAEGEHEDDEILWVDEKDFIPGKMVNSELPIWLERLKDPNKGISQSLLDWPESIKELQRNWIGKSEGAEIKFKVKSSKLEVEEQVEVFTTRPDTLFGVTYVVLAPEHKLIQELLPSIENKKEVTSYIEQTKKEDLINRTDEKKEKTGVPLKGVFAINPANNEKVSVWIADYVLADYGTGAVMAVPAHDERDWDFAKKYGLEIKQVIAPYFENKTDLIPRKDKSTIVRSNIHAIIRNPKTNKYLLQKWKEQGWQSFVTGGIEDNENIIDAAKREVLEETGYKNLKHIPKITESWEVHSYFYAKHKDINRYMKARAVFFELVNEDLTEIHNDDKDKYEIAWLDESQVRDYLSYGNQKVIWDFYSGSLAYINDGVLINSAQFNSKQSTEIMKDITSFVGGKWVTKYKLRDWVFSRQRYWGEPIPVIHCEKCGVVPVPEKDLPVKLPKVKSYEPTGTGESPLAAIDKWVNVKCPKCVAEKNKTKYLVFDFDGVLGDTWDVQLQAKVDMGDSKDIETAARSAIDWFSGVSDHTRNHNSTNEQMSSRIAWNAKFGQLIAESKFSLFDNFVKELKKLKNTKFAVVSSGSSQYVVPALKNSGIKFTHILAFEGHHSKEEKVEKICKDWGISVKDAYYFTDTNQDVYELETLLDRKRIIGCAWGYLGFDLLKEVLPENQILKEPKELGKVFNIDCKAKRETNTMPQWAGSSWYYLRYEDPKNNKQLVDPKKEKYWSLVDTYVGGAEHATRHLIYARFWHKFLYDIGMVSTLEPFKKLQHVGLIMGEDGRKMSKRFGNVINPDELVGQFGADTLRVYEMFMGPFDQQISWSTAGMVGCRRFIEKVWRLSKNVEKGGEKANDKIESIIHKTIKKVTEDIETMRFNTAISAMMIAVNEMEKAENITRNQLEALLKLLAPFAPHFTEEMWSVLGNKKSIHISEWPKFDLSLLGNEQVIIVVQVNGKVRASFVTNKDSDRILLEQKAKDITEVKKWTDGKTIIKVIVVPNKLINIVC